MRSQFCSPMKLGIQKIIFTAIRINEKFVCTQFLSMRSKENRNTLRVPRTRTKYGDYFPSKTPQLTCRVFNSWGKTQANTGTHLCKSFTCVYSTKCLYTCMWVIDNLGCVPQSPYLSWFNNNSCRYKKRQVHFVNHPVQKHVFSVMFNYKTKSVSGMLNYTWKFWNRIQILEFVNLTDQKWFIKEPRWLKIFLSWLSIHVYC